jgi:hypothetical protein
MSHAGVRPLSHAVPRLVVAAVLLAGCGGDTTGPPPPQSYGASLRLVSPNGPEGAAVLEVNAGSVSGVTGDGDSAYSVQAGDRLRIVLLRRTAGTLRAHLTLPTTSDPGIPFDPTVIQVADSLNALRSDLTGYSVAVVLEATK